MRVVAEMGQCHEGSVPAAIDGAVRAQVAGCWGIKFQLLKPESIAQPDAAIYWDDAEGRTTQRETFEQAGIIEYEDFGPIKSKCDEIGIEFLATPFDLEAVAALDAIGCEWIKIASGDITHLPLLRAISQTGMRAILSTGASTLEEIDLAVSCLGDSIAVVMACSLIYPTPSELANLAQISALRTRFPGIETGYSDHTTSVLTSFGAAALGAMMLEKHYTTNPGGSQVPDHSMALSPHQMAEYVANAVEGEAARGSDSTMLVPQEERARVGARRSCCAGRSMSKGDLVDLEDITWLRPLVTDGFEPGETDELVGHRLAVDLVQGDPFTRSSFVLERADHQHV